MRAALPLVLLVALLSGCEDQGNTPAPKVKVAWAVRGQAGKSVAIETSPGSWRKYTMPKGGTGVGGTLTVERGKSAKLWADLSSGETLTCVLTDRTGYSSQDTGPGHCQVRLEAR